MPQVIRFALILAVVTSLFPADAVAQGETTSAIVGEVTDATDAVVPGAANDGREALPASRNFSKTSR